MRRNFNLDTSARSHGRVIEPITIHRSEKKDRRMSIFGNAPTSRVFIKDLPSESRRAAQKILKDMQNDDYGQALDQGRSRSRNTRAELSLWDYNGYTRSNNNIDQDGFKIPVIKNRITLPLRGQNGDAITLPQYLKHNEDYRGGRDANIVRSRVVTKTSRPIDERFAVDEEPVTSANVRYNKRCFLDHENELSVTGDEDCEPLNGLFAKRRKKLNQIIEESEKPKGKNQWTGSKLSKIAARLFESIPPLNLSNDSGTTFSAGLAEIGKQIFGRRNRSESDKTITFGSSEISNKVYRPSVTLHNMTTGLLDNKRLDITRTGKKDSSHCDLQTQQNESLIAGGYEGINYISQQDLATPLYGQSIENNMSQFIRNYIDENVRYEHHESQDYEDSQISQFVENCEDVSPFGTSRDQPTQENGYINTQILQNVNDLELFHATQDNYFVVPSPNGNNFNGEREDISFEDEYDILTTQNFNN